MSNILNLDDTRKYLTWLTGEEDPVVDFTVWADSPKFRGKVGDRRGRLSDLQEKLSKLNLAGAGIGVRINEMSGLGTRTDDVVKVRAIMLDSDGGPIKDTHDSALKARGRAGDHDLYLMDPQMGVQESLYMAQKMAMKFRTDPATCLPTQVDRLPGFANMKDSDSPVVVELVQAPERVVWEREDFLQEMGLPIQAVHPDRWKDYILWHTASKADGFDGTLIPDWGTPEWATAKSQVQAWVKARTALEKFRGEAEGLINRDKTSDLFDDLLDGYELVSVIEPRTSSERAAEWLKLASQAEPYHPDRDWAHVALWARIHTVLLTYGMDITCPEIPYPSVENPWKKKLVKELETKAVYWMKRCRGYESAIVAFEAQGPGLGEAAPQPPTPYSPGKIDTNEIKAWRKSRSKGTGGLDLSKWDIGQMTKDLGIYLSEDAERIYVQCFNAGEHSSPAGPTTTAIMKPSEGGIPGYRCFRGCCQGKGIIDFVRHYRAEMPRYCEARSPSGSTEATEVLLGGQKRRMPAGWAEKDGQLMKAFISEAGDDWRPIAASVPYISAICTDVEADTEQVTLEWDRYGSQRSITVSRRFVADRNRLVALSDHGFPATSGNVNDLVDYLAAYEVANPGLPKRRVASSMGWTKCGRAFLLGDQVIGDPEEEVSYEPSDEGLRELKDGIKAAGDPKAWYAMANRAAQHPAAALALGASLAAPLLQLLQGRGFAVDLSGPTSRGKTTCCRLAASVWGSADEGDQGSMLRTWGATPTWIERAAAARSHLPMILDDTKGARRPEDVPDTIYTLVRGQGRGRGKIEGLRRTVTWKTVAIISGEEPSFSKGKGQAAGATARTLLHWGAPFEGDWAAKLVSEVNLTCSESYGHAGPEYLRYLLEVVEEHGVEALRLGYRKAAGDLLSMLDDPSPVAHRMADSMALVYSALTLAAKAWGGRVKINPDVIQKAWLKAASEGEETDVAKRALESVYSRAVSSRGSFWPPQDDHVPYGGWLGRWDQDGDLCLAPDFARRVLEEGGFDPETTFRVWKDREWLTIQGKHMARKVRIDGSAIRCYCIPVAVIEAQILDGDPVWDKEPVKFADEDDYEADNIIPLFQEHKPSRRVSVAAVGDEKPIIEAWRERHGLEHKMTYSPSVDLYNVNGRFPEAALQDAKRVGLTIYDLDRSLRKSQ